MKYRLYAKSKVKSAESQISTLKGSEVSDNDSDDDSCSVSSCSSSNDVDLIDLDKLQIPITIVGSGNQKDKIGTVPKIDFELEAL